MHNNTRWQDSKLLEQLGGYFYSLIAMKAKVCL
jgi:hypothetical protein